MGVTHYLSLAERCLAEGDFSSVESHCHAVLRSSPQHPGALHILALAKQQQDKLGEAISTFKRAVSSGARSPKLYADYGLLLSVVGRDAEALEFLLAALEMQPRHPIIHMRLAGVLRKLGEFESAEQHYNQAIKVAPHDLPTLVNFGDLLLVTGRENQAIAKFEQALKLAPNDSRIHVLLGRAHESLGNESDAKSAFCRALAVNPNDTAAIARLGVLAKNRGDFSEAVEYFTRIDGVSTRAMLLECLFFLERYDEFHARLEKIAATEQDNLRVAAISAYAADVLGCEDVYPFCPDPLNYVQVVSQPGGRSLDKDFLQDLIREGNDKDMLWEATELSTRNGFETAPTIFDSPSGSYLRLRTILEKEIDNYRVSLQANQPVQADQAAFLRDWPNEGRLKGWFLRYLTGGYQDVHNHPMGWLSGVLYLQAPPARRAPEGALELSLSGPGYTKKQSAGVGPVVYQPMAGQLILFPSSVWHRTIPFSDPAERYCIAFDFAPTPS